MAEAPNGPYHGGTLDFGITPALHRESIRVVSRDAKTRMNANRAQLVTSTCGAWPGACTITRVTPPAVPANRTPDDDRARQVAVALLDHPADKRTLPEWGREVGASERTLARAFLAETGVSFGRWRTMLRIQAALTALAAGEPVTVVARRVGYDSDSAFVQAFRRETGVTPSAYFRAS